MTQIVDKNTRDYGFADTEPDLLKIFEQQRTRRVSVLRNISELFDQLSRRDEQKNIYAPLADFMRSAINIADHVITKAAKWSQPIESRP